MKQALADRVQWLGPIAGLVVFGVAAIVLHREFSEFKVADVLAYLGAIPRASVAGALALTVVSYWWLGFYDVLAQRYARKVVAYGRTVLAAFVAYAFGHNLALAGFTAAAVRLRLYGASGLSAIEVATVSAFCSITSMLGLALLASMSLLFEPRQIALALHIDRRLPVALGAVLFAIVFTYFVWAAFARKPLEFRGWTLRQPGPRIAVAQLALGVTDFSLAGLVLWMLLPPEAHIGYFAFTGMYAGAIAAGLLSHVPGGLGVFEAAIALMLPEVPKDRLLGALVAYRAIYYIAPLLMGALTLLTVELRPRLLRWVRASTYIAPLVPQVAAALTFIAGAVLLLSGATPSIDVRIDVLARLLPLVIIEGSHLIGSLIGLGLVVLAAALHRRVRAAYHIAVMLLVAGIVASLLKGLDIEEALLLAIVLGVLMLGRDAFYRPASILAERFTPVWVVSIVGVVAVTVWVGFLAYRNVDYSDDLWWTFAFEADAPRMLRAAVVVSVICAGVLLANLLRPARPEPSTASAEDLARARAVIARSDQTIGNAALMGDKRLLFSDDSSAFLMYQVTGRSWVALGDPVGPSNGVDDLLWRFRELADLHGGWSVFYQASRERLAQYVDLGLAAFKIGEEARVPLATFSLEGSERADLRQDHRRCVRDGAVFEVVLAKDVPALLPQLRGVSESWLGDKSTAEKHFSVGSFDNDYLSRFDVALVRRAGEIVAFANLWETGTKHELSIDLMRFGPNSPRSAMDFLFAELMLWGREQGYGWFNLGMAPLAGLEQHPLAPVWHRVGNFVFRYGEHFYNFEGLRRYKAKFRPEWEPKYLVAPGGIALPRIMFDVSALIAGGVKELLTK